MGRKSSKIEFIRDANRIHQRKYNYSHFEYGGWNTKSLIICKIHGVFYQTPNNHKKGRGCPKCKFEKLSNLFSKTYDEFLIKSNKIHNNKYDYSKFIYKNCKTKSIIICPLHGEFLQSGECHLRGYGCPKCNVSKGELKIKDFLENNNIEYISQKTFDDFKNPKTGWKLRFDFYIPSKNLLIEYDGEQHFRPILMMGKYKMTNEQLKYIKFKDRIKNRYAKSKNITLMRIKYNQINSIDKLLNNIF